MAGLGVAVSVSPPACLLGHYGDYPAIDRAPDVVLDIEQRSDFALGRVRGPGYPGFERRMVQPGELALRRFDAEGTLHMPAQPAQPVTGAFVVGASENSVEAIIRIAMSVALPRRQGLLMHASAIEVDGGAHIFAGVSGAGKSTISTMLDESWPACTKLSDELLIVAPQMPPRSTTQIARAGEAGTDATDRSEVAASFAVHVTPFIGSAGLPHGRRVPVRALYFLHQAPHHECRSLSRTDGLRELLRHVLVYVAESETADRVLEVASSLVHQISCHELYFAKDPGVASVLAIT